MLLYNRSPMRPLLLALFLRLFSALPLAFVRGVGRALGWVFYRLPNRELRNARVNLELCFPELDSGAREALLRETLQANAVTLCEMPKAWRRGPGYWVPRIRADGAAAELRERMAGGRGLIVAAPHLGNWEVGVHWLTSVAPTTVLYRPPREASLERVMVHGRAQGGGKLVPTTRQGIRALHQALGVGEMVAILPDQMPKQAGAAGVFAPFFGRPALTMGLVNRLARKTAAHVVLLYVAREADGGYRVHWFDADPDIASADPVAAAAALNRGVEACVRQCPVQYQWTYRRFESSPDGSPSPYRRHP